MPFVLRMRFNARLFIIIAILLAVLISLSIAHGIYLLSPNLSMFRMLKLSVLPAIGLSLFGTFTGYLFFKFTYYFKATSKGVSQYFLFIPRTIEWERAITLPVRFGRRDGMLFREAGSSKFFWIPSGASNYDKMMEFLKEHNFLKKSDSDCMEFYEYAQNANLGISTIWARFRNRVVKSLPLRAFEYLLFAAVIIWIFLQTKKSMSHKLRYMNMYLEPPPNHSELLDAQFEAGSY